MKLFFMRYLLIERLAMLSLLIMACPTVLPGLVDICRADDWSPPPPTGKDGFDWIQLKSGEWLKGRIRYLQQDKLEFDSEKLDIHVWDWKDILVVRSPRMLSMRFGEKKIIDGSLLVTGNEVKVVNQAGTQTFPRSELLAITPTGNRELDKWSIDVSLGINASGGNTQEISYNTHVTLQRQTPLIRQKLDFTGNYGKIDDVVNKDDHRWLANSDFFLSDRFFIRIPDIEYFHDSQQNIAHRVTVGSSAGYDLIKNPRTEWQITAGPAFQNNNYDSVETGMSNTVNSSALVLGSRIETELTQRLDLTLEYRGQFTGQNNGSNMHHTVSTLEYEIHKRLTLDLTFTWDRITEPETGSNGVTPKQDDFQLTTSLGIHF